MERSRLKTVEFIILVPGNHDYPWNVAGNRETNFKEFVRDFGKSAEIDVFFCLKD